jgi:hypothetical protein
VLLGRLSDVQLQRQGRNFGLPSPKASQRLAANSSPKRSIDVCEPFLSYWKRNGLRDPNMSSDGRSLALFGLPLSEPAPEKNSSGQDVVTQWFERARFEFHPDKPQQYQFYLVCSEMRRLVRRKWSAGQLDKHRLIVVIFYA